MSRLTSTQVIALGEYLEPEFEPSSLTVSQLLGVLGYHNIQYPTPYSKPKLVQVFKDEVKAKSTKLKRERMKSLNSLPSDDGITDGVTGKPLTTRKVAARRSLRHSSQAPFDFDDDEPPAPPPDPPKRRRSSAQPTLGGGTLRRKALVQQTLTEESEPDDEEVLPPKKIAKSKKAAEASRRTSNFAEDSGWEDNNIFQSGAESSSPARPSPRQRVPRKSGTVRRSRKSMSAPPEMADSSPTRYSPFSPPQSSFSPRFERPPPLIFPSPRKSIPAPPLVRQVLEEEESIDEAHADEVITPIKEESPVDVQSEEEQEEEEQAEEGEEEEGENDLVSTKEDDDSLSTMDELDTRDSSVFPGVVRFSCLLSLLVGAILAWGYKMESAPIGFCDTGSRTNSALEGVRAYRVAIDSCNKENRTELYPSTDGNNPTIICPLPPLLPIPHADSCTPCPEHAVCSRFSVQCDNGFLPKPPPLLAFLPDPPQSYNLSISSSSAPSEIIWSVLSSGLNGLPGLGPIALPPRCVLDPRRQKNIGALGKAMESLLSQERGRRLCVGGKELDTEFADEDGGEARKWGVELATLRENMKRKTGSRLKPAFDDTFNEAVQELVRWGGVLLGADKEGNRYLASRDADLTWDCVLTVKSREVWAAWRTTALGAVVAVLFAVFARLRVVQKKSEARRVSELVQIALDTLRNQELAHHTDPVTAPQPYLSSIQLRDVILQNEHSIPTRRRLWDKVEHIVEGNTNVRANLEEIEGGDELRVWRWVGSTGRGLV
ncbi:hypothetical protein FA15DRAFT_663201 [Coprinopsis marcescibilis]|uniref:Man1/Src1 C-terminal domain-containing protein n=1 Tax=Coprinopsis marcescibilis TaxID=230819 RepID=A0A5C3LA49_COPMA|nr:hypothetical protein FA15DRAFT_663201 [Coprinopsis marcescibilis]